MADLIIPDGFGNAVFRVHMTGKTNLMTFTMGYATIVPDTSVEDAAESLATTIATDGGAFTDEFIGSSFTLQDVLCYQNDGGIVTSAIAEIGVTGAGGLATPPVNSSCLVQKHTARVGRKFRGRWYVPNLWFAENTIDQMGVIGDSPLGIVRAALTITTDALQDNEVAKPFLLHSETGLAPTSINSWTLLGKVATQRRRLRS